MRLISLNKISSVTTNIVKINWFKNVGKEIDSNLYSFIKNYCQELNIHNEIKLLKLMSYEIHFPVFYNKIVSDKNTYLLYRYIEGIDLFEMIKKPLFLFDKNTISKIIFEIATGLDYLFCHNFVHLDIKP